MSDTPSSPPPRVRIAPSPTGDPHVGTAYMALFNLAFARRHGGAFLLRIEDTDRTRYRADSEARILEALAWLDLAHDEGPGIGGECGPYYQSQRTEIYVQHVEQLMERGHAYRCFCTAERLDHMRSEQKAAKARFGYDRKCRSLSEEEVAAELAGGAEHVVRLAAPLEGKTTWVDLVRDGIEFANEEIDDQVLLKSDGFPTYHLANVVDDRLMGITHVIRGEEWISSTPKHLMLYDAFGWERPRFAHMPLLRRPGGAKISKRKDPTNILWFRDQGYLPEALRNFLGNMGFSVGDDDEIYDLDRLFREFDFGRVKGRGPEFDFDKLDWMNGEYIRMLDEEDFLARAQAFMAHVAASVDRFQPVSDDDWATAKKSAEKKRLEDEDMRRARLRLVARLHAHHVERPEILPAARPHVRERLKTWADLAQQMQFYYEQLHYDAEELVPKGESPPTTHAVLRSLLESYGSEESWATDALEARGRALVEESGWKPKKLFQALRVAITFSKVSPPLFQSMEILGKTESLRRLQHAMDVLEGTDA